MSFLIENEDWQVTREIYEDAIVDESDDTATQRIPISLINMIAIRVLLHVPGAVHLSIIILNISYPSQTHESPPSMDLFTVTRLTD